ncbi:MAG: ATP-binding protein [Methanobrevibacter sp.]|jgi:hypothetical protein|nr:ATP-binding protein [Methanobrevibacter sp.]
MAKLQKLPVGIQSFEELRTNDYLYVDKTKDIFNLIDNGKVYFLSRPRRFGKSLLVSTLKELFQGNKDLFEGLYIYDKWNWDEEYPIIHLDFSGRSYRDGEKLTNSLNIFLKRTAKLYGIELEKTDLFADNFGILIEELYFKTRQKVVILIDEYDKPIVSNIKNSELDEIQEILGDFYEVLKTNDQYIKFIFITGVSKFAHVSLFSKLNSLDDLTLVNEYNSICGYTQDELEGNFKDHIKALSIKYDCSIEKVLENLKFFYDGYSWNGLDKVYNPFSTLLCFRHLEFSKGWFNSGTPSVLANHIISKSNIQSLSEPVKLSKDDLTNPSTKVLKDEVLLFQTGYLTVSKKESQGLNTFYTLKIPNYEVETGLFQSLIEHYSAIPLSDVLNYGIDLTNYLIEGNCEKVKETIGDYLAPIPNVLRGDNEKYYHSLILILLLSSKQHVHSEIRRWKGNADIVIEEKDYVIILEFKHTKKTSIEYEIKNAFKQIEEQEYSRVYKNKKVIKAVIVFKDSAIGCKINKEQ